MVEGTDGNATGDQPVRERWRETLLPDDSTVGRAIRNLDESALQIVLTVSAENVLIGTVTDGDIRRGRANQ